MRGVTAIPSKRCRIPVEMSVRIRAAERLLSLMTSPTNPNRKGLASSLTLFDVALFDFRPEGAPTNQPMATPGRNSATAKGLSPARAKHPAFTQRAAFLTTACGIRGHVQLCRPFRAYGWSRTVPRALPWVLLTPEPVREFADAWRVIEWYEKRPLVEEYHKCIKTGCSVEARQYRTGDRLAPVIGLLSIVAVRLLQLKMVARREPDRPAAKVVPTNWLAALPRLLKRPKPIVTVRDFFRGLASLGGFLGRKADGGGPAGKRCGKCVETLLQCLRGAEALGTKCG